MTARIWFTLLMQVLLIIPKLPFLLILRVWKPFWYLRSELLSTFPGPSREQYLANLDRETYLNSGDGAKFIGLLYFVTKTEEDWELLKKFWRPTTFARYTDPARDADSENFSGDMIAGMLWGLWYRFRTVGFTKAEWENLAAIWENTVFNGTPFTFKHPTGKTGQDRGYLLSKLSFGNEVLTLAAFLYFGNKVFSNGRYWKIAKVFLACLKPLLCMPDVGFAYKKVYAASWYDEHSEMLLYAVGFGCCPLERRELFMNGADFLHKRYTSNPEIQAIYSNAFSADWSPYCWVPRDFLKDYQMGQVGTYKCPDAWKTKYFSLISLFKRENPVKEMSMFVLPTRFRSGKYLWEGKDIDPHIENKGGAFIDYLHLDALINQPYYPPNL